MSGSDEDRTITDWRTESRLYRRKPGLGWILALIAIPVLLALIGLGTLSGSKKDVDLAVPSVPASATLTVPSAPAMTGPAMTGPDANVPGAGFAPFSILRGGNGFTLAGELPDVDMKNSLLESVKLALPGASVIDNLTVTPGVKPPDFAKLGGLFGASVPIPDFSLNLVGDTITLTGTAPSEAAKAEVEAATADTWPNVKIVNNIQVTAASATTAPPSSATPTARATMPSTFHSATTGRNRLQTLSFRMVLPAGRSPSRGAGSAEPVADNDTPAGRAQNRRVEITVS